MSRSEGALLGHGILRFAQLLAVGLAWGGPLLLAVFAGFGLRTYTHPRLARPFAVHGWLLLAAMLALACLGIALVAPLMRRPTRVRLIWLLVPAGIVLVGVTPFVAPGRSFPVFFALSLAMMVIPLVVVLLGAAITTVTLWRRSRWLGITWLSCWLGGVAFLVYATSETADSGGPAMASLSCLWSLPSLSSSSLPRRSPRCCAASPTGPTMPGASNRAFEQARRSSPPGRRVSARSSMPGR